MRVALFIDHWKPERGGAERCLAALVARLLAGGHDVLVFGLTADPGAPGEFHVVDAGRRARGDLERALAERSLRAAREERCDVTLAIRHVPQVDVYWPHGGLHAKTLWAGASARGKLAGGISRLFHGLSPRHRAFLDLEETLLGDDGAGRIWCVSQLVADEIVHAYPACAGRIELHPNGVDRERFHPGLRDEFRDAVLRELGVAPAAPVFLFLGGNRRLKGWRLLLDALQGATELAWSCIIADPEPQEAALEAVRAGLARRFAAAPWQDSRRLYGAADLLVQPTWRDPCSLATLEALSAGVPVLTTTANGAADAITDEDVGTVVPPGDPGALAQALVSWVDELADPLVQARRRRKAAESTRGRGLDAWLDGLVASLEHAAAAQG